MTELVPEMVNDNEPGGISRRNFLQYGALAAAGGVLASSRTIRSLVGAAASTPSYGGRLRVASAFGGPTDTLDPGKSADGIDYYRVNALFDSLCYMDANFNIVPSLAEVLEPNKDGSVWTIRTRAGVTWHDGKPLTAADVLYTLQRDQKLQLVGTNATAIIDFASVKQLDTRTLQVPLTVPRADWPIDLMDPLDIVQDGATDFRHPIGTGPFEYVSFTPGQSSLFKKNPNYWVTGRPYLDELELSTISDPTSRVDALVAGQVDAVDQLAYETSRQYRGTKAFQFIETESGNFIPFTMRVDVAPFNDVRVRQAMRLLVNRPGLVEVAQLGVGRVGNDVEGYGQPDYPYALPQRQQNIAQAMHLLKAAGQAGLTVELNTSALQPGMLEASTAFAQQAKAAGVTIKINNIPPANFFGPNYLKYPFGVSGWAWLPIELFLAAALVPGAPYNETHWNNATFNQLYVKARGTFNAAMRKQYLVEAQEMLWNDGGYIIWGLSPNLDGYGNTVHIPEVAQKFEMGGGNSFYEFWVD
jgi:peptide/nickel transport system substrate-binding protein